MFKNFRISQASSLNFNHYFLDNFNYQLKRWGQPFISTDLIRVQVAASILRNMSFNLIRLDTDVAVDFVLTTYTVGEERIYDIVITGLIEGEYRFDISAWGNIEASAFFCLINEEEAEGTLLIHHTNYKDENDTIYTDENEANLYFDLRVDGVFLPDGLQPQVDDESFRDQFTSLRQVFAEPYNGQTLFIGENQSRGVYGVPVWMIAKINYIFAQSRVLIEDQLFTRASSAVPEKVAVQEKTPFYFISIDVERTDDLEKEEVDPGDFDFDNVRVYSRTIEAGTSTRLEGSKITIVHPRGTVYAETYANGESLSEIGPANIGETIHVTAEHEGYITQEREVEIDDSYVSVPFQMVADSSEVIPSVTFTARICDVLNGGLLPQVYDGSLRLFYVPPGGTPVQLGGAIAILAGYATVVGTNIPVGSTFYWTYWEIPTGLTFIPGQTCSDRRSTGILADNTRCEEQLNEDGTAPEFNSYWGTETASTVTGTVIDTNGTRLSGVTIRVFSTGVIPEVKAVTNAQGVYTATVYGGAQGTNFSVVMNSTSTHNQTVGGGSLNYGGTTTVNLTPTLREFNLRLSGTVLQQGTNIPIPNASISATLEDQSEGTTTDTRGEYTVGFTNVKAGQVARAIASVNGYIEGSAELTLTTSIVNNGYGYFPNIALSLSPENTLNVRVQVRGASGEFLADANIGVSLNGTSYGTYVTGTNGQSIFSVLGAAVGDVLKFEVTAMAYVTKTVSQTITQSDLDTELRSIIDLTAVPNSFEVRGTVRDYNNREYLPGCVALLSYEDANGNLIDSTWVTGAVGGYQANAFYARFANGAVNNYVRVELYYQGYNTFTTRIQITSTMLTQGYLNVICSLSPVTHDGYCMNTVEIRDNAGNFIPGSFLIITREGFPDHELVLPLNAGTRTVLMAGLLLNEPFTITASADGYVTRTVDYVVTSLYLGSAASPALRTSSITLNTI